MAQAVACSRPARLDPSRSSMLASAPAIRCRCGGTGIRSGLKIRSHYNGLWVRVPSPAPLISEGLEPLWSTRPYGPRFSCPAPGTLRRQACLVYGNFCSLQPHFRDPIFIKNPVLRPQKGGECSNAVCTLHAAKMLRPHSDVAKASPAGLLDSLAATT